MTAASAGIWAALAGGQLIADRGPAACSANGRPRLPGLRRRLVPLRLRAGAALGIPGVDAVVTSGLAGRLGLAAGVAVLVNAAGADLAALMRQVQGILGSGGTVRNLVPVTTTIALPFGEERAFRAWRLAGPVPGVGRAVCPGLSWTVLAAIGQIESGDGANEGPSSAGALGPMQFMPSTWRIWGTTGSARPGRRTS